MHEDRTSRQGRHMECVAAGSPTYRPEDRNRRRAANLDCDPGEKIAKDRRSPIFGSLGVPGLFSLAVT
jgi:hypothetical protein